MSIWQKAYETYENHAHLAGVEKPEFKQALTPVGHIVQKAQIEITIRADGTFYSASPIDQKDCKTIIPATEASAARTREPIPHPLCEQLGYLIPGSKRYADYVQQLTAWANSPHTTPKVNAILQYVRGGTILQDLVGEKLIALQEDGTLASGKTANTDYEKCMIRWKVNGCSVPSAVWQDADLFTAFQKFQKSRQGDKGLCMISGKPDTIAASHPKGTLAGSYGAKLISANDGSGFTYRGRFTEPDQAATIGYDASQKVHSALQWLCANQGVVRGGRTFLIWNPKGKPVFSPMKEYDLWDDEEEAPPPVTPSDYRERLEKALDGWKDELPDGEDVVIAAFEAATTGRLSITYYSEMKASDYHARLRHWFDTTGMVNYSRSFRNPALELIVKSAYGVERGKWLEADDKVLREQLQHLLKCMTEGAAIPEGLVNALCNRASHPLYYKEWTNRATVLFCACALLRKYLNDKANKEEWKMVLDEKQDDRSYLYGRMLAVMEYIERSTYGREENREPNAIRMQTVFAQRPLDTAKILEERLEPYYRKLSPGQRTWCKNKLGQLHALFREEDWNQMNAPLDGKYLLGYHQQRNALYQKKTEKTAAEEE